MFFLGSVVKNKETASTMIQWTPRARQAGPVRQAKSLSNRGSLTVAVGSHHGWLETLGGHRKPFWLFCWTIHHCYCLPHIPSTHHPLRSARIQRTWQQARVGLSLRSTSHWIWNHNFVLPNFVNCKAVRFDRSWEAKPINFFTQNGRSAVKRFQIGYAMSKVKILASL